ncbi:zinc transporter ZupT [Ignavigranum ruoffiae]|uniref:Zinc transporter ZupT n=1 Tax=Ignavigranum ruoffiae TaxID=89093 RepID=A0A1H8ZAF1_9LACT|nr:zinc transporter ZupT [Ignavigranum ruoffiae]UPQ85529.1 zinc transporter ZupT [Ignavigranum ruoffiae]SEP61321.1 zinc transporter, ZIP family [Ignavigranum ruoffiae]
MTNHWQELLLAFLVTLLAGLSTGIGSLVVYRKRELNTNFLAGSLGFSAGVMLYLSLIEILPESRVALAEIYGDRLGLIYTTLAFFAGMIILIAINRFVPSPDFFKSSLNHQHADPTLSSGELYRVGILTMLAIAIHNFPEGFANFIGTLHNPALGLRLSLAIAIHNIPEGISVAIPIYFATANRRKAVRISFLSGVSEPLGALLGFLLFRQFISEATFGVLFAMIAGIMTYISIDELLPIAEKYGDHKFVIRGILTGMAVIALSLVI